MLFAVSCMYGDFLLIEILTCFYTQIVALQPDTNSKSSREQKPRNQRVEQKAAKTTAIIVGVFLFFWLPLILFSGIHGAHASGESFLRGFRWVQIVSMCNSAVNPYVYCIRSTRYRLAMARIIELKNIDMAQLSLTFAQSTANRN